MCCSIQYTVCTQALPYFHFIPFHFLWTVFSLTSSLTLSPRFLWESIKGCHIIEHLAVTILHTNEIPSPSELQRSSIAINAALLTSQSKPSPLIYLQMCASALAPVTKVYILHTFAIIHNNLCWLLTEQKNTRNTYVCTHIYEMAVCIREKVRQREGRNTLFQKCCFQLSESNIHAEPWSIVKFVKRFPRLNFES